jgi:hypothetical protein
VVAGVCAVVSVIVLHPARLVALVHFHRSYFLAGCALLSHAVFMVVVLRRVVFVLLHRK